MKIWKMNLERLEREYGTNSDQSKPGKPGRKATLPHVEFDAEEIMDFAKGHWETCTPNKSHWNGRQIKNAFQTAIALAEWDAMDIQRKHKLKEPISIVLQNHHFKKVADASANFDEYLVAVRKTDSYNAKAKSNRLDEYIDQGTSSMYGTTYATYEERQQQRRNVKRVPVQAEMGEDEDQDDDLRVRKPNSLLEMRRYLPDDRARKEPVELGEASGRGNRRNEQYVPAKKLNSGQKVEYDDEDD